MYTRILAISALVIALSIPMFGQTLTRRVYDATAILYSQTMSGGMDMRCTATAYKKVDDGYHFISAAHCVASDDAGSESVKVSQLPFYISFDSTTSKTFHPATVLMAGYGQAGDDFAILHVKTKDTWETIPIGNVDLVDPGNEVFNVAAPAGLGRQLFFGRVSLLNLDRPVLARGINWNGATLLQIASGPGSSGSAVISMKQEAIVFFIVGSISGNPSVVSIPASKFLEFRDAVEAGTYKHFSLEGEEKAAA